MHVCFEKTPGAFFLNSPKSKKIFKTGEEGAELWLLTVYMTVAGSMMLYQTCYATTFKKTEITTLPYLNKDYNTAGVSYSTD